MADGVRRVVVMSHAEHGEWFIDVGDSASDADARAVAEAHAPTNGDGWTYDRIVDRLPAEDE